MSQRTIYYFGGYTPLNEKPQSTIMATDNYIMGSRTRALLKSLFFIKALLAFLLGTTVITYNVRLVAQMYFDAPKALAPIQFPEFGSQQASLCFFKEGRRARLEPPEGSFFWGFSLDWSVDTPQKLQERLGRNPALINTFIKMTPTDFEQDIIEWNAQTVQQLGGLLEITLMLTVAPQEIPQQQYLKFARLMRKVNSEYGVAVLLRFMHEMNGPWMEYGMKPIQFKDAWIRMTNTVRSQTNLTAMVWSPNIGGGYPFFGAGFDQNIPSATNDPQNFAVLNTKKSGTRLSGDDDPYEPYYPGDEYVDWIGISLYNLARKNGQHLPTVADVFTRPDRNNQISLYGGKVPFYPKYVEAKNKPFMFSETGSATIFELTPGTVEMKATTQIELSSKQAWWSAILNDSIFASPNTKLSKLKAAVWFEERKVERAYDAPFADVIRDYRITYNETVKAAFLKDLDKIGNKITYARNFEFGCDGTFRIHQ